MRPFGDSSLPGNRLHVFPNHLQVPGFHVADVRSDDEHPAGVAQGKVRLSLKRTLTYSVPSLTEWVIKSTTLPWTTGYLSRNRAWCFLICLAIFLCSLALIGVMGVLPIHTTFGFIAVRILVVAFSPAWRS
jgi:hypothetical protein